VRCHHLTIPASQFESKLMEEGVLLCVNEQVVKVDWRLTIADTRFKLKYLYPKIRV
jgi:hypothetical protein